MADPPNLQIHARLKSPELRARLDAYCERKRWSIATAINVLVEEGIAADERAQGADQEGPNATR